MGKQKKLYYCCVLTDTCTPVLFDISYFRFSFLENICEQKKNILLDPFHVTKIIYKKVSFVNVSAISLMHLLTVSLEKYAQALGTFL